MHEGKPLKMKQSNSDKFRGTNKEAVTELNTKWKLLFRNMMKAPGVQPIPKDLLTFFQSSYEPCHHD